MGSPTSTAPPRHRLDPAPPSKVGGRYSNYVLAVLVVVYVLNFLDRNIVSILNEHIKADLDLTDAEMGFLYGTAFAVFYAVFGIPLGRLADVWTRRTIIAIGLSFWSVMTALSGLARNFGQIGIARIGVGVGEASASPAAYSMLSDYFPPTRRATVLSVYSSGIYIGGGLGLLIGGQIVDRWDTAFAGGGAPFGLEGWRVAFLAVGLPGILLSLLVRSLREPLRGQADGILSPPEPHPFRQAFLELRSVLPPLTVLHLWRLGAGRRTLLANLVAGVLVTLGALGLIRLTGDTAQWLALGIGVYAAISWSQGLGLRDRPTATLVLGSASLRWAFLGFGALAFAGYGLGYWIAPFLLRFHGADIGELGLKVGGATVVGGLIGVTMGGMVADRLRSRWVNGRLYVAIAAAVIPVPLMLWFLHTDSLAMAYGLILPFQLFGAMWLGIAASTAQDLVLPRMRASAGALYILLNTLIGLALGPYLIGRLSVSFQDLRGAMLIAVGSYGVAFISLLIATRYLRRDESTMRERARAAGEPLV